MNLNTYMKAKRGRYGPDTDDPQLMLALVGTMITALEKRRRRAEAETQRLQKYNPVQATLHYRKDANGEPRYLYLVHPQKNGHRVREYIGADPDKCRQALKRVAAHRRIVAHQRDLDAIETRLDLITRLLARCLRVAINGHTW